MKINPNALANAGLGLIALMYAQGKTPPQWLTIPAFMLTLTKFVTDVEQVIVTDVEETQEEDLNIYG